MFTTDRKLEDMNLAGDPKPETPVGVVIGKVQYYFKDTVGEDHIDCTIIVYPGDDRLVIDTEFKDFKVIMDDYHKE